MIGGGINDVLGQISAPPPVDQADTDPTMALPGTGIGQITTQFAGLRPVEQKPPPSQPPIASPAINAWKEQYGSTIARRPEDEIRDQTLQRYLKSDQTALQEFVAARKTLQDLLALGDTEKMKEALAARLRAGGNEPSPTQGAEGSIDNELHRLIMEATFPHDLTTAAGRQISEIVKRMLPMVPYEGKAPLGGFDWIRAPQERLPDGNFKPFSPDVDY